MLREGPDWWRTAGAAQPGLLGRGRLMDVRFVNLTRDLHRPWLERAHEEKLEKVEIHRWAKAGNLVAAPCVDSLSERVQRGMTSAEHC